MGGVCRRSRSSGQSQARAARCSEIGQQSAANLQEAGVPIGDLQPALEAAKAKSEQLEHKSSEVANSLRNR